MTLVAAARAIGQRRRGILYGICGLAAVFLVPYLFGVEPARSSSYYFGYNNRVGVILLLVFLAGAAVWNSGTAFTFAGASQPPKPMPRRILVFWLLALLVGCAAMYVFTGSAGGFGESTYWTDRVWLIAQGKRPYLDFEWVFGVLWLYVAYGLERVFQLSVGQSFFAVWVLNFLLGTWALFGVIDGIDYPTEKKRPIFLMLMAALSLNILNMGAQAVLRHALPLFLVLTVDRALRRGGRHDRLLAGVLAIVFTGVLLLSSPETAVAHGFACVCLFLLGGRRRSEQLAGTAGLAAAVGALFLVAQRLHVFDTMRADSGGADSFPIVPAPHLLLFVAGLFVCACYLNRRLRQGDLHDNTLCLILYSIPMMAAALGRCDRDHVFMNGLGIFICCLFYVSNQPRLWRWYSAGFVCFIFLIPAVEGVWFSAPAFGRVWMNNVEEGGNVEAIAAFTGMAERFILPQLDLATRQKMEVRLAAMRTRGNSARDVNLAAIYPIWRGKFAAPFGYRPNGVGTYLSDRIDYGFYEGLENANTVSAVERKMDDLTREPQTALLLHDRFEGQCAVDGVGELRSIQYLFLIPYRVSLRHGTSVYAPLCDYIRMHYTMSMAPSAENFRYGLWVRKPEPAGQ